MDSKIARKVARSKIPPPPDGRCIINQLPPELLAYIFQLGVELEAEGEDDEDLFSDISSETEEEKPYLPFEVLVSHVCKHWRDIATNLPNLWTSIDFAGPYDRSITYLERAQQAPLDISLDLEDLDADDPEVKDLITIAGLILPRVSQWRTFELIVSDFSLMAIVLKNLSACPAAPILESLSLYNHDNIEDMDHFEPAALRDVPELLFNGNVPRLKKIALWGVHLLWERTPFLKNLEEIELAYHAEDVRPSYKVFTNMLKESPNLRSLALCNSGPAGGPVDWLESVTEGHEGEPVPPPTTQISLPSLNQLALTYESAPYVTSLMQRLEVPNLADLSLDLEADDYGTFLSMISKPTAKQKKPLLTGLTHLKITDIVCSHVTVYEALNTLENVTSLNLNFHYLDLIWYDLLMGDSRGVEGINLNDRVLCPKLKEFTSRGLSGTLVLAFVKRREEAGKSLSKVLLEDTDELEEDEERQIKEHVELEFFEGSDTEDEDEDFPGLVDLMVEGLEDEEEEENVEGDVEADDGNEEWTTDSDMDDLD